MTHGNSLCVAVHWQGSETSHDKASHYFNFRCLPLPWDLHDIFFLFLSSGGGVQHRGAVFH